ncbi:NAD(P)-dependent oxidoreductase, partial [Methylibium sp. T29-B]|uniref:NAD(P)-dependent oxidoreductase n=1 Tax=Methylibium sp. T29-B TaxID=1437443 RepID=UPI00055D1D9F
MKLALLGTGLMGAPMTRRLCAAGLDVTVWNRTRAKAEALAPAGARVADTPEAAVRTAELVITMLEHGDIVEELLFAHGLADTLPRGALLVDMSSIRPAQARAHAAALAERGVAHLDARSRA